MAHGQRLRHDHVVRRREVLLTGRRALAWDVEVNKKALK
jgi:hypothetical protein